MTPFIEGSPHPRDLAPLLRTAREEGRSTLLEHEALELVAGLGLKVPTYQVISDAESAHGLELDRYPGNRVVVKALAPELLHKTESGGVAVTPARPEAVARAAWEMEEALSHLELQGFLVEAFVEHDMEPGGELLLGMRHSREFGPVVTLGLGGVAAELLARELPPGQGVCSFSPELAPDPEAILESLEGSLLLKLATGRIRGRAGRAAAEVVADTVARFLEVAPRLLPNPLVELEVNPLVFTPGGPVALDAVARLASADEQEESPPPSRPRAQIRRLLRPGSMAVVGASRTMNPGRAILRNVLAAGFPPDRVTVVKPGLDELDGCRCVPDLDALADPVDLLVLAVSADQVPGLLNRVIQGHRAQSVILIPGGLGEGESDDEPVRRLRAGLEKARRAGEWTPVVNGGNCLGIRSVPGSYDTLFIPRYKLPLREGEPDPVAVISQSGAWAIARTSHLPELKPRYLITFGNQLDLTVSDHLRAVAEDDRVRVVACYVEGFRPGDGREFLDAATALTDQGRCVVLYRAGRSPEGSKAAASHTASVAGDYALTADLARQAGVLVAETAREFHQLTALAAALDGRRVEGLGLGAVSNAGFECVAMADHAGGLALADLAPDTRARLRETLEEAGLDGIVAPRNPLDVTPILGDRGFAEAARAVLEDPGVDVGAVGCVPLTPALKTLPGGQASPEDLAGPDAVASGLIRLWKETEKGWVAVVDGGPPYDPLARMLSQGGIPVFRAADEALRLLGAYAGWRIRTRSR